MPTAPTPSRDAAIEAGVFWLRFKNEIAAALLIALLAIAGFGGYRLYTNSRDSAASTLLGGAKNAQDYQEVIARYPTTPAGASAYLLLAQTQRNEKKFAEANTTLQAFIDKNPGHELIPTARMAMASNLESMGKNDEALSIYQQVAAEYPRSFSAPLALISQVPLLKAKNRTEDVRRICEEIMTQYRDSYWTLEAVRELRSLKLSGPSNPPPATAVPPLLAAPIPTQAAPALQPSGAPTPRAKKPR